MALPPTKALLLISNEPDDRKLAMRVAHDCGLSLEQATRLDDVRRILSSTPNMLTFWRADNQTAFHEVGEVIPKYVKPSRIVAITEKPMDQYVHLYRAPIFGHHILRRIDGPALEFYPRLMTASLDEQFHGLDRYFPKATPIKKLKLEKPEHKTAATEAVHNFLTKQGLRGRISALVAQATDELLINAMVVAPKLAKKARLKGPTEGFPPVEFEVGVGAGYMGVCVRDGYGMLRKLEVYQSLRKHYDRGETRVHDGTSLGLHGLLKSGLSLLLTSTSSVETEVMLFFPLVENYREFKSGMRFFTVVEKSSV